jgi:hypothetical protein
MKWNTTVVVDVYALHDGPQKKKTINEFDIG